MQELAISKKKSGGIPVWLIKPDEISGIQHLISPKAAVWSKQTGFKGKKGQIALMCDEKGKMSGVLFGQGTEFGPLDVGTLANRLPQGDFRIENMSSDPQISALGWMLGAYQFQKYKKTSKSVARLVLPKGVNSDSLRRTAEACFLARDLVNTPANDMGPADLEKSARSLARTHKATISVTKGEQLLKKNFPMIHAVGRACDEAPRLIEINWGPKNAPKITLVGKGVTFDTGGLNIKPGGSMALMKKDMGGAANILGLAHMIMDAGLKVRLRVLIPAVENSISGNSFRPGDILQSRHGISVEIGNTDAEGRLVLADALALADEENPEIIIDMATLTGAARVALGPDLPPYYTHDDKLAQELSTASRVMHDPLWQMPLWAPYQTMLGSKVADVNHISTGGFAGSITAALFLSRFVKQTTSWVHLDIFGWVPTAKPWAPVGGEAQGIRALFEVLSNRYS